MIKDMLVCLEGSPSSTQAVELAIRLGLVLEATLVGLAIVDEPDIRAGAATGIGGSSYKKDRDAALLKDAHEHAEQWTEAFLNRCREVGVAAQAMERRGQPSKIILEEMGRHDLTLIGRLVNFLFETESEDHQTRDAVVARSPKPVLVVPQEPVDERKTTVVIAFDGSSACKRALRAFAESGLHRDRAIHVASVGDEGTAAYELAASGCELLRGMGIKAEPHSVVSALSIAEAILEQARKLAAAMVVSGAYTHSRLSHLIWGSVTHELLEKTTVPLFLHQ
jgi:nucleotide-binding universal stress UspA family protein